MGGLAGCYDYTIESWKPVTAKISLYYTTILID